MKDRINQSIRNSLEEKVFERDRYRCKVCDNGSQKLSVHHITPIAEIPLGQNILQNCITLCSSCKDKALCQRKKTQPKPVRSADKNFSYLPPISIYHKDSLYELIGTDKNSIKTLIWIHQLRSSSTEIQPYD